MSEPMYSHTFLMNLQREHAERIKALEIDVQTAGIAFKMVADAESARADALEQQLQQAQAEAKRLHELVNGYADHTWQCHLVTVGDLAGDGSGCSCGWNDAQAALSQQAEGGTE